mgnify:CR=1 FL=1
MEVSMGDLQEFAAQMCESIGSATGLIAAVSDRDSIIALSGAPKRELMDKPNSRELDKLMESRKNYRYMPGDTLLRAAEGSDKYHLGVASPILSTLITTYTTNHNHVAYATCVIRC